MPLITILMPVFNAGDYLKPSIESVFKQTHRDFEFVVVDDASSDINTRHCMQQASADKRFKLVTLQNHMGIAGALNRGLQLATGEYIARMDADDICHPQRLEKQLRFMNDHPDVGICGTAVKCFGGGVPGLTIVHPQDPEEIKCRLLLSCPISHPTVMFRHESLRRHQLRYNEEFVTAQDYDLWVRCARHFPMANLREPLLFYRVHDGQNQQNPARHINIKRVIRCQWDGLGLSYSEEELERFYEAVHCPNPGASSTRRDVLNSMRSIFARIVRSNNERLEYNPVVLKKVISKFWMTTLAGEKHYSWTLWKRYRRNAYEQASLPEQARLFIKCLIHWESRDPRRLIL
jgi:glycosyltransferase involved in cell wall biosynthesis